MVYLTVVQPAIRTCACRTVPDDVFASEEERVHPFYLSGSAQLTQGALGRTPFQNVLLFKSSWFLSFLFLAQISFKSAAVQRPV
jgi:hypothetical protein